MNMKHLKRINEEVENKKLVIVSGDDWEGIYIDGKLINEGHHIDWYYLMKKLGYDINNIYIENEETWEKLDYHCPDKLEDVEIILNSEKYNL